MTEGSLEFQTTSDFSLTLSLKLAFLKILLFILKSRLREQTLWGCRSNKSYNTWKSSGNHKILTNVSQKWEELSQMQLCSYCLHGRLFSLVLIANQSLFVKDASTLLASENEACGVYEWREQNFNGAKSQIEYSFLCRLHTATYHWKRVAAHLHVRPLGSELLAHSMCCSD